MSKITREKFKTYGDVFDQHTNRNLFTLASRGLFEDLKSPISIGKEANVFSAETREEQDVVVKIYRLETCDFNQMYDYIKRDERYENLKGKRRQIIFSWCQREFRNLLKAREAGVRVPTPYQFKDNILVMELVGEGNTPAPKLKDDLPEDLEDFFGRTIAAMRRLHRAGLVHGDLSEFNILNHRNEPVLIDFSQATTTRSVDARMLLERDCRNMARFFSKHGHDTTAEDVKERVTAE